MAFFYSYQQKVIAVDYTADQDIYDWKADLALADLSRMVGNLARAQKTYKQLADKKADLSLIRKRLELIERQKKQLNSLLNS